MLTPNGQQAEHLDKVMLLAMWARYFQKQGQKIIIAGIGKPTLAINENYIKAAEKYWSNLKNISRESHQYFKENRQISIDRDIVAKMGGAVGYGDPQGEEEFRIIMAKTLRRWYPMVPFKSEDILFTVGGAGGLHNILKIINDNYPGSKIITPFPYYSLYATTDMRTQLHPIDLMQEPGYCLTANALRKSINEIIKNNKNKIGAFLFCDPHNPLGTIVGENWIEISKVLEEFPNIPIVLDEAYAELRWDRNLQQSLLDFAPKLWERIILLRSGTKSMSTAGERAAILATANTNLMNQLLIQNILISGHVPLSIQNSFTYAFNHLKEDDLEELRMFYKPQVELAQKYIDKLKLNLPDASYKVQGAFYVVVNLQEFFGLNIPDNMQKSLGKSGKIETDEDIAYFLLSEGLMITPLSYFGVDPRLGYLRITCSGGDSEIYAIFNLLSNILLRLRKDKITSFATLQKYFHKKNLEEMN